MSALSQLANQLIAPFTKLITTGRPWVIAKWAMTLDGKIASRTGNSQWISNEASRAIVHRLRGQVDAILVGRGTAEADDPLLTARPAGSRVATRIVLDANAALAPDSQLVQSIDQAPLLVATTATASPENRQRLVDCGAEVLLLTGESRDEQLQSLLKELGRRQMTNLLVEGGGEVLGTCFDLGAVDEVHAFIAPTIVGGNAAPPPVAGLGFASIHEGIKLERPHIEVREDNVYVRGYTK